MESIYDCRLDGEIPRSCENSVMNGFLGAKSLLGNFFRACGRRSHGLAQFIRVRSEIFIISFLFLGLGGCRVLDQMNYEAMAQSGKLSEFELASYAMSKGLCRTAWEQMWPLAKRGDHEAQLLLWGASLQYLAYPGDFERHVWNRHKLTLAAYGALAAPESNLLRKEIPIYIRELDLGPKGKQVSKCYERGSSFKECLTLAVSLGVVQKFEDYARDVDVVAQQPGMSAGCVYPH